MSWGRASTSGADGWPDSFPRHNSSAQTLELEAQSLFQARKYEASRGKYLSALALEPTFLSAQLGLACVAFRQEKVAEAVNRVSMLLAHGFVPWHRVAADDIDLAGLWEGDRAPQLANRVADAAVRWGQRVGEGILLLSRLETPVKLAREDGPLLWRPGQEIVSWNPRTGRFHQVSAEGGRVLAFLQSPNRADVLYLTVQKIRRRNGILQSYEGVGVHRLHLANMQLTSRHLGKPADSFSSLTLWFSRGIPTIKATAHVGPAVAFSFPGELVVLPPKTAAPRGALTVTPRMPLKKTVIATSIHSGCRFQLVATTGASGWPTVDLLLGGRGRWTLPTRYGLGIGTLPLVEMDSKILTP